VSVAIDAAYQRGRIVRAGDLTYMRRDEAHRETDTSIVGAIGLGAMHDQHVVQRRLARFEFQCDTPRRIDVDRDLLAARQQVVGGKSIAMGELLVLRARHHAHRAGTHGAR